MSSFEAFLRDRLAAGGFSTEDALQSFLPLARQVAAQHAAGRVAPLSGVAALQVEEARIWFHESQARAPERALAEVQRLDRPRGAVEVLSEHDRRIDADAGQARSRNLRIGTREEVPTRPVYLPGYVAWEQLVGHHDPVTDVFVLGLVLASLACGLDLSDPAELERFVEGRRNLFRLRPGLHPVLAKAIVKMTELSRHDRPQELATLVDNLEHYRDQQVDFAFDLARSEAGAPSDRPGEVILGKLQERLFEISRRNRLLHYRATLQSVNLTHASVPLSFDVARIRPEQILTWSGPFSAELSAGKPVSLSKHLDFAEQVYLPSVLDRVRADAARDAAEYGFEQLRLALCFLRWADLKADPPEPYDSPLVLLPVKLVKKKGVRDSWWLQPLGTEAEVNPVVRHLFRQLHGIALPETVDLSETTLEALHEELSRKVAESEPGVTVRKVDRPRIDLLHDLAQRRLDRFRKTARLSGKGIRSFLDLDYSYDPANYHPLGLALFRARIRQAPTHLKAILSERPEPRRWAGPPAEGQAPAAEGSKRFYALREEADDNPYHWEFDLCRVTLGNFKYRKMTLVRDYAEILEHAPASPAFDAVFSLAPRPLDAEAPQAPPPEERFHVVACDPTQATAIGLARAGTSAIIQGPPGTGKSQTITNLIADYVVRGKRVLFVCEKRAAIDVVFARLRQQGLDPLCCLIHDSQADKKAFIQDLKTTYEGLLASQAAAGPSWRQRRSALLAALRAELAPIADFDAAMRAAPGPVGVPLREALERAIALADAQPALTDREREALPPYAEWAGHRAAAEAAAEAIRELQPDGILAHHPLRLLAPAAVAHDRPHALVSDGVAAALPELAALREALAAAGPSADGRTLDEVRELGAWALDLEWLAERRLLGLLDEHGEAARRLSAALAALEAAQARLARAREATAGWRDPLPADDLQRALPLCRALEGRFTSAFKPAWWRLRKALAARYDRSRHAVAPRWTEVLEALAEAHAAAAEVERLEREAQAAFAGGAPLGELAAALGRARARAGALPPRWRPLHHDAVAAADPRPLVSALAAAGRRAERLVAVLDGFLVSQGGLGLDGLEEVLRGMPRALPALGEAVHALGLLAALPPRLAAALRTLPLTPRQLEAALAARGVDEQLAAVRALARLDGRRRDQHLAQAAKLADLLLEANAGAVLERAREGFLEHLRVSGLPAAELTREQKDFKAAYNRGRRDLEHEFGKVMRHRSIRDLVAGDSGAVVFDLKPVWLMSPLSVSDTLPLAGSAFDVVIFDEASQITLESAVPAVFRAPQVIVVGDEMQLPPTDFFSARDAGSDDEPVLLGDDGRVFEYDLSANSLLAHSARTLPSRLLGWHYRSRSESLVAFSNWAFYQGRLLTVPESRTAAGGSGAIVVGAATDGDVHVDRLLERPLSHHLVADGCYEGRKNRQEAAYIARLVRGLLALPERRSIGVVAFSEAQQEEIEAALAALAREDAAFAERLEAEWEREEDGQFVGLLVKNLENIQGDERDVMILSVCYGRAPDGKMRMNFGPINQSGGEKRLNVAFTRAKHHMAVVASVGHGEITNDYNDGARCLKDYLRYAEAASAGDTAGAVRVLRELAAWRELGRAPEAAADGPLLQALSGALEARGYAVTPGVGMSSFRCDLAVRRHGEARFRLGLLLDHDAHYAQQDLLERDLMRPRLLRAFGWDVLTVLAADWHRDREAVLARIVERLEAGDGPDAPPSAGEEDDEGDDPWAALDAAIAAAQATRPAPGATPAASAGTAPPPAPPAGNGPPPAGTRHLVFVGGSSRKFWEVRVEGATVTVRFGRIGSAGQTQQKLFADEATARRAAEGLAREKLAKGYVERGEAG